VGKRHPQEWIAAAVMAVVLALIVLDLVDSSFNTWFDRHSFSTDAVSTLLGLAVAALVVDRVSDRRRLRDRSQVMAAQGAMIAAQALRATQSVTSALDGSGDRDAAADEVRTFMTLMLTGAPVLMDAPRTRGFLQDSQRLSAELARALLVTRDGQRPDDVDQRLNDAAGQVRSSVQPLLQTLNLDQQFAVWGAGRLPSDDTPPAADPPAADPPAADPPAADPPAAGGPAADPAAAGGPAADPPAANEVPSEPSPGAGSD
jgi:hypothetical protein